MSHSGIRDSPRGYALVITIVILAVLLTVAVSTVQLTRTELHSTADQAARQQAFYVAEAGIQRGIAQLDWERGMASTYVGYSYSGSSESFGNGSYTVTIAQDSLFPTDPTRKLVTATGTTNANQSARLVAHVVVKPLTVSNPPSATPTLGSNTTPTPGGNATPTYGPPTPGSVVSTPTAGPPPTSTPGVPPPMPTPTPTSSTTSILNGVCENHELLVSYNGTAKLINEVAATSQLFSGTIFSNADVTFQLDAAVANDASGSVYARNNFNNSGLALGVLSMMTNANLYYGGSYVKAAGDTHLLTCGLLSICVGAHFGSSPPYHGTLTTIPKAIQPPQSFARLKRFANVIVNKDYQPFGSWDSSSGTWLVNGHSFPAGTQTHYYVDGNVKLGAISLLRTAAPWIVARGWISMTTLQVSSTGLLSGDVQTIYLLAEKDLEIGRDVTNVSVPTFQSESTVLTLAQGIQLATVLDHTLNVFGYSVRGEVWGMVNNLSTLSKPKICLLGNQNATLAFTGTIGSVVKSLN